MIFAVTKQWLNDTGRIYEAKVIKRFLNGFLVERNGITVPIMKDDIEIIEISEAEKKLPLSF